jgi:hypothetical protein
MRRPCFLLVLCVLLGFGVCLAVLAEDVPETVYDESDSLPYEGTPLCFTTVSQPVASRVPAPRAHISPLWSGSLREPGQRHLDHSAGSPYPVSDSLIILDHSLRC